MQCIVQDETIVFKENQIFFVNVYLDFLDVHCNKKVLVFTFYKNH